MGTDATARDPADRLASFRDQADSFAQRLDAVQSRAAEITRTDDSGSVAVTLAAEGYLRDVAVRPDWRTRIQEETLAAAVRGAATAAALARVEAWAGAFADQSDEPDPRPRQAPPVHASLAGQLDELVPTPLNATQGQAALAELLAMLDAVDRSIDEVSAQVQAQLGVGYSGRSQGGHVTATVLGSGDIADLRYDPRWLATAHELNIGRETTDALRAAYRRAAQHPMTEVVANSPLGEIAQLSQDPLRLARRLHLRDT
ncbi:MAG: hypothetical protein J2P15_23375 [Micromonosporaceae bacterium]|nr:hypothetical protein [Micromonosporaceae bacterium]